MARAKKNQAAAKDRKKLVFPARVCLRLDDDVRGLLNASVDRGVEWASQAHAINAGLRRSMIAFAPTNIQVRLDPFEQLVFAKRRIRRK